MTKEELIIAGNKISNNAKSGWSPLNSKATNFGLLDMTVEGETFLALVWDMEGEEGIYSDGAGGMLGGYIGIEIAYELGWDIKRS